MRFTKLLFFLFVLALIPNAGIYSKVPLDREQYLKLEELLRLVAAFNETGLNVGNFDEITLKDGGRVLKLTQFSQMMDYIDNEIGPFNEELQGIEFEIDKISVNSYEYVRGIIEERRRKNDPVEKVGKTVNYFANSQILRELELKDSRNLSKYR